MKADLPPTTGPRRLTEAEYGHSPVWSDCGAEGDMAADERGECALFSSVAELRRRCTVYGVPVPDTAHGSCRRVFALDASQIIDDALVEHHEEAQFTREAEAELQPLLDAWVAKHGNQIETWEQDTTTVVVLDKEPSRDNG